MSFRDNMLRTIPELSVEIDTLTGEVTIPAPVREEGEPDVVITGCEMGEDGILAITLERLRKVGA